MMEVEVAEMERGEAVAVTRETEVTDAEYRRTEGPPTGGAGRGEIPPWPATLEEGEWQVLHLERAIAEIISDLTTTPAAAYALTSRTPNQYEAWRARAERALETKRRQRDERRLWVQQQQRALGQRRAAAEDATGLLAAVREHYRVVAGITPTTPDAEALLSRAAQLLRAWNQEFEPEDLTQEETALIGLLEDYLSVRGQR